MADEPDLNPHEAARLAGCSYWSILRYVERGELRAYRRGKRLAIRRDEFDAWRYGDPVVPKERQISTLAPVRTLARPTQVGSVQSLDAIEKRFQV